MDDQSTWKVLDTYVRDNPTFLTQHHLESFDDFVHNKIPNIVKSLNPFVVLKNDDSGKLLHEIKVYIGGKDPSNARINLLSPAVYPNEARLKSLTYQGDLVADITVETLTYGRGGVITDTFTKQINGLKVGAVPIMLGSTHCKTRGLEDALKREIGECVYDKGGYFVVDGKEKVIVAQERIATNRLFVSKSKEPNFTHAALIRCTPEEGAIFPKKVEFRAHKNKHILVSIPNIKKEIPLFVLFRALGVESDKNVLEHILRQDLDNAPPYVLDFLFYSIVHGSVAYTQADAIGLLQKLAEYDNEDHVRYILMNDLFPNMNETAGISLAKKAMFLGDLANTFVFTVLGKIPETDRDNYAFKRVDISGFLMANLFRDLYNVFRNECRSTLDREYNYGPAKKKTAVSNLVNDSNIWKIFNARVIEDGMRTSLKGRWGGGEDPSKLGIVQDLSRLSYMGFMSHLRRVNTPIDRSIKIVAPHRLHPTQWGAMCPYESPDGANIGLLKNLAMLCHITSDVPSKEIMRCLLDLGLLPLVGLYPRDTVGATRVFVNNNWVGITREPEVMTHKLRTLRRCALINIMTSIAWDIVGLTIRISTDAGRCCRPLYVVLPGNKLVVDGIKWRTWQDLIIGDPKDTTYTPPKESWQDLERRQAAVEFIDVEESNNCLIAMTLENLADEGKTYTHCEIHPSTTFAVLTANIPFANHNQAPRNYFSGAQGKQAIGVYSTQFNNRMDTAGLVLHYPQRSIVNTRYMHYMNNVDLPNGENAIVAIMCYSGYNQEDSIILNKSAVERGMFNLTYFKTMEEVEELDKFTGERVLFSNPVEMAKSGTSVDGFGKRFANYAKLDADGLPKENIKYGPGDVYIGKVVASTDQVAQSGDMFGTKARVEKFRDTSAIANKTMAFIVDKVFVYEGPNGLKRCKIRTRKVRKPVLGDKHASRHAQKGTIGMILKQEDMPFTKDGIVPDLIINPHAIPTRMTIGHLIECLMGKVGCLHGNEYDATPFCNQDIPRAYDDLQRLGYERYGNEILYNGHTGEQIATDIFIGPTYMLRLKHMVEDKLNVRTLEEGGYTGLTRQPVQSRAKGGGLRVGEMEVGAIAAHGMASFLKESMMERSDSYTYAIDNTTGDIAVANLQKGFARSLEDPFSTDFTYVQTPYAMKLFLQELQCMGIGPKVMFEAPEQAYEDDELDSEDDDSERDV